MKQITLKRTQFVEFRKRLPIFEKYVNGEMNCLLMPHVDHFAVFYGKTLLGVIGMEDESWAGKYVSLKNIKKIDFA